MGYVFYSYLAFITPSSAADLPTLCTRLQASFEQVELAPVLMQADDKLTVTFEDYQFTIYHAAGPYVQEEALEIAADSLQDWADEPIDRAALGACDQRFELHGDPDPDMLYFNDSLTILSELEELGGIIIIPSF